MIYKKNIKIFMEEPFLIAVLQEYFSLSLMLWLKRHTLADEGRESHTQKDKQTDNYINKAMDTLER